MLTKSTFLFLVFTFVADGALEESTNQLYFTEKGYKFNHPPSFEAFNEEANELKSRKVRQTVKTADDIQKEYVQVIRPKSTDNISLSLSAKIPVPVTYTTSTDIIRSENAQSNSTSKKMRKRKRTRRPNNTENENVKSPKINESIDTIKSTTESTATTTYTGPRTIVPKIFTKRPPQYNPVAKKIRQRDPVVKILDSSNYVYAHKGNFHYSFEGADGTRISSEGQLKSFNDDKTGEAVVGSVFYKDNDGNDVSLSYTADENGYRPEGAHLPTPPPIPPAIARALAHLATKTTPLPVTEPTSE